MYDAVVAGGSISGLLAAREIAKNGHSVLVLEEGFEVGSPEHCGGLVSKNALKELGIEPSQKTFDSEIECAKIFSPEGKEISINSKKQQIVVRLLCWDMFFCVVVSNRPIGPIPIGPIGPIPIGPIPIGPIGRYR